MGIKAVLFDLDGTLLPMDQESFIKAYFGGLSAHLAPHGFEPRALIDSIWRGTAAMVKNDGKRTNEAAFLDTFVDIYGEDVRGALGLFDSFYAEHFDKVKESCGFDGRAFEVVEALRSRGYRVVLATNPLFPSIATEKRMAWAGLSPSQFELYTTYENSRHSKPNLDYYRDILASLGLDAEDCLMVGNDVGEDMVARKLGMKVYLVTACLINRGGEDISAYPNGDLDGLVYYLDKLKEEEE